jgi:outer membrane protein assembly factor BamB
MARKHPLSDLVFVGFNSKIAALHRESGKLAWKWTSPAGTGYVALLLDGDLLLASVEGYTYAIEAATGTQLWANPLKGFGTGIACLATMNGSSVSVSGAAAQKALAARRGGAGYPAVP